MRPLTGNRRGKDLEFTSRLSRTETAFLVFLRRWLGDRADPDWSTTLAFAFSILETGRAVKRRTRVCADVKPIGLAPS